MSFFILYLYILNDSEFIKSVGKVWQICRLLYTIESITYFTVDLQLVINDLGFLKEYGQSFFLETLLIIGGDKSFKNLFPFAFQKVH